MEGFLPQLFTSIFSIDLARKEVEIHFIHESEM